MRLKRDNLVADERKKNVCVFFLDMIIACAVYLCFTVRVLYCRGKNCRKKKRTNCIDLRPHDHYFN